MNDVERRGRGQGWIIQRILGKSPTQVSKVPLSLRWQLERDLVSVLSYSSVGKLLISSGIFLKNITTNLERYPHTVGSPTMAWKQCLQHRLASPKWMGSVKHSADFTADCAEARQTGDNNPKPKFWWCPNKAGWSHKPRYCENEGEYSFNGLVPVKMRVLIPPPIYSLFSKYPPFLSTHSEKQGDCFPLAQGEATRNF